MLRPRRTPPTVAATLLLALAACVLAGHLLHTSTLVELAPWTGGGAVRG
jgi:hypothetical protein